MDFRKSAASILILWLALLVTANPCPAEGLLFFEQREVSGAPLPELSAQPHQVVINLAGTWDHRIDGDGAFVPGWIPGCFRGDETPISFRREFVLHDSLRSLHFQLFLPEIHYAAEVWINGSLAATVAGSHLGFSMDVPRDRLRFGTRNELIIRLDNTLSPRTTLPVRPQVLHPANYGGLFSGVYLRAVPAWSVESLSMRTEDLRDPSSIRVNVKARVAQWRSEAQAADSAAIPGEIRLRIALMDTLGNVLSEIRSDPLARNGNETQQLSLALPRFAAEHWSPDHPALYELRADLIASADTLHRLSRRIGFKDILVREGEIVLNGAPLRIQGFDYIPEDYRGGRAITPSTLIKDLEKIRGLGMNTIRVPFGPPPSALLDAADAVGLLVLVENDISWVPGDILKVPAFANLSMQAMEKLIFGFSEHVSVMAWGLGSQLNWSDPAARAFSEELYRFVKSRDNRPCFVETSQPSTVAGLADFVLAVSPDAFGPHDGGRGEMPLIVSRIGKLAATPGSSAQNAAGIVNQAEYLLRQVSALKNDATVNGYLIHAFSDYHGYSPLLAQPNQTDPLLYSYGVVTFDRQERLACAKLQELVQSGEARPPVPAVPDAQIPAAFPIVGMAALILLFVELRRNNVFRQNLKRVFLHAHGFYSDLRYRRFLHTAQPLLLLLLESITLSLLLAAVFYTQRESLAFDYYLTHFLPWVQAKAWLVNLIWDPIRLVIYCTIFFFGLILLQILVVRIVALFFIERVDLWQASNYVIWAFAALLYLLPLAIIFYRLLEMPGVATLAMFVLAAGLLWCFTRLLGALRTGYGASPIKVYSVVFGIGVVAIVAAVVLLENRLGTLTYLQFFHDVFRVR